MLIIKLIFPGRLKQAVKTEKSSAQEEPQYEKAETVDQIKKKYGYSSSSPTCVRIAPSFSRTLMFLYATTTTFHHRVAPT